MTAEHSPKLDFQIARRAIGQFLILNLKFLIVLAITIVIGNFLPYPSRVLPLDSFAAFLSEFVGAFFFVFWAAYFVWFLINIIQAISYTLSSCFPENTTVSSSQISGTTVFACCIIIVALILLAAVIQWSVGILFK